MEWKSNINIHSSKQMLFFSFCALFLGKWKNVLKFRMLLISRWSFYQDYFWKLQYTDRFSSLNHRTYRREKISKCYLIISHFHKKLVWLLSFWIEYGSNYQLLFFPESKFNVYLWNLRWCHYRFKTLRIYYRGFFNFPTSKIWKIDPLGTS